MQIKQLRYGSVAIFLSLAVCELALLAHAQTLQVLHVFKGSDGLNPWSALVQGSDGNFYGTTQFGGDFNRGTVFKTAPEGTLITLVHFNNTNGALPQGGFIQGSDGNFYGTTTYGTTTMGGNSYGTLFQMTPDGALTTLVQFNNSNGSTPQALCQGGDGNLYGTTYSGGNLSFGAGFGGGTVFQMKMDGTFTTLAKFDGSNGNYPTGDVVQGRDGNFYGTTEGGGTQGSGTVFKMSPNGVITTIFSFNGTNGALPESVRLVQATDDSFYGTTSEGGSGCGTIFKITPSGGLTNLVEFSGVNGCSPWAGLVQGRDGNFYGTTHDGGDFGWGTVFQMTSDGNLTTLISFAATNGAYPEATLTQGEDGNLYGTTYLGGDLSLRNGYGNGTVFRVVMPPPPPTLRIAQNGTRLVLSWPTNAIGFTLQSSTDVSSSANWTDSTAPPLMVADEYVVTNTIPAAAQFYRLKK